jgi:hypothetical protein
MMREASEVLERDETSDLISSEKVDGTAVFNREGERLGTIHHFMVGKRDGKVHCAVMSFGGILGMGESHYPLPWNALEYDTDRDGYVVDLDKDKLKSGPSYAPDTRPTYGPAYIGRVYSYYGFPY